MPTQPYSYITTITMNSNPGIERHPWEPFLPANAKILFLGSFPPPRKRWSMDFYYPNATNDFWKIMGFLFFGNERHFVTQNGKGFDIASIKNFLNEKGIALYDAATAVIRAKNNASDQFLQIVESTDIALLLSKIPHCTTIAVTGLKSAQAVLAPFGIVTPEIGRYVELTYNQQKAALYRMPSTSRAYPLALHKKAAYYKTLFEQAGIECP